MLSPTAEAKWNALNKKKRAARPSKRNEIYNQYAFAKMTRLFDGFPEKMSTPSSKSSSRGIQRRVAFVASLIASSVSVVPSQ